MRSHIPCKIPIMHLLALKDLRSTFELGPKDTIILGKAIFLSRVGFNNHLWSMRCLT